jgi:hypothetical protein
MIPSVFVNVRKHILKIRSSENFRKNNQTKKPFAKGFNFCNSIVAPLDMTNPKTGGAQI